jgi:hypothetical protein
MMDQINPKSFTTKAPSTPSFTKKAKIGFAVLGTPLCPWCLGGEAFVAIHQQHTD